jgi:hypothetical protein
VRNCNGPAQQPKVLVAKASPQAAPASSDFLKGVQTALSGAMTGPASGPASSAPSSPPRQQQAALPPAPKPPIRPEDQLHGQFEAPMPAPRPSSLGVAIAPIGAAKPLPQAEITKDIPAYLRPIPGSAPTLEPRFISLQAALRKLNPQK